MLGKPLEVGNRAGVGGIVQGADIEDESPFVVWNAAKFSGTSADGRTLLRCMERAVAAAEVDLSRRATWIQVEKLCLGLLCRMYGDHRGAIRCLRTLGETASMGGSPAQRELIDLLVSRESAELHGT